MSAFSARPLNFKEQARMSYVVVRVAREQEILTLTRENRIRLVSVWSAPIPLKYTNRKVPSSPFTPPSWKAFNAASG